MITVEDLHWEDIKRNICGHCGACVPFCEWEKCKGDIKYDKLGTCDICYLFCTRNASSAINYNTKVTNYYSITSVKSVVPSENSQDGSFVSTLLKFLLRDNIIDSVIMTRRNEAWKPEAFIATTESEIDSASGSKYSIVPAVSLLKEATEKYKKIAFVGLPCQIRALRNVQLQKKHNFNADRIILAVGLFCRENFIYENLKGFVEKQGFKMADVKKFDISAGKFKIYYDSSITEKPIKELNDHVWPICHSCIDFTSDFADISAGSVGSKKGFTTVLVRTQVGKEMFGKMIEKELFTIDHELNLPLLEKLSNDKRKNIENLPEDVRKILLF